MGPVKKEAHNTATNRLRLASLNMSSAQWSYICCKKTSSSSCASKHK